VTIGQEDNYARECIVPPTRISFDSGDEPVITLVNWDTDETVYAIRGHGDGFDARVFEPGAYEVRVDGSVRETISVN